MSARIADARKAIGMTQRTLAEKLGIAASTLNGYEKRKSQAGFRYIDCCIIHHWMHHRLSIESS